MLTSCGGQLPERVATVHQGKVGLVCGLEPSTLLRTQSPKRTPGSSAHISLSAGGRGGAETAHQPQQYRA